MWLILTDGLQKRCSKIDVPFFFFLSEVNCALKVLGFFFFKGIEWQVLLGGDAFYNEKNY